MFFRRGLVSPFRKAPRHRFPTTEDLELEREIRQAHRRKTDTWMFAAILIAPVVLIFVYELGHTMFYMQDVKSFAATLDQRPPADVKRNLQRYARNLTDFNPAIRDASMMAMKLATGWNAGNSPTEWQRTWLEQEPYWEYRRAAATNAAPLDWRSQLPAKP